MQGHMGDEMEPGFIEEVLEILLWGLTTLNKAVGCILLLQ